MKEALAPYRRLVVDNTRGDLNHVLAEYGARAYPSLVFLDAGGEISGVLAGVQPPGAVVRAAQRTAAR